MHSEQKKFLFIISFIVDIWAGNHGLIDWFVLKWKRSSVSKEDHLIPTSLARVGLNQVLKALFYLTWNT